MSEYVHPETKSLIVLGSTGSVGQQALEVVVRHPDKLRLVALAAHRNGERLQAQASTLGAAAPALFLTDSATAQSFPGVGAGMDALIDYIETSDADIVLNAFVGVAGLRATLATLRSGKRLALANKESLVVGGSLVTDLAAPGQLLPVDSEHSAIFQCLQGEPRAALTRIWLTASGGPFRGLTRAQLAAVTAADALAHPTWLMGPKITVDSATYMNKGLEVIEAHHLFDLDYDCIDVLIQPQSLIHSMTEFADGSVKAHLGAADMRVPIQYALSWPDRWSSSVPPVDFRLREGLDFGAPDTDTFACLTLALAAGRAGGTAPAVLNAANEVAVAAFLAGKCGFLDIEGAVSATMDVLASKCEPVQSFEQLREVDSRARKYALGWLKR